MAGVGNRRDGGKLQVSSTNGFAALGSLRKKKSGSGSGKGSSKSRSKSAGETVHEEKPKVVWAPTPLAAKSWADVEDDEDDDYFATTAPPQMVWGTARQEEMEGSTKEETHETESEDDILEYVDEDEDEEPEHDHEIPAPAEPVKVDSPSPLVSKETEKQLSKKELKKKELAELDAVLAEFGIANKEEVKPHQQEGNAEKTETAPPPLPSESKASKKKKKKASKEVKDLSAQQPNGTNLPGPEEATGSERSVDNGGTFDAKAKLKKVASSKKKKSSKDMDAAAKAAAVEAAARSAKLAAAKKKKEKNHYNQQPVR